MTLGDLGSISVYSPQYSFFTDSLLGVIEQDSSFSLDGLLEAELLTGLGMTSDELIGMADLETQTEYAYLGTLIDTLV